MSDYWRFLLESSRPGMQGMPREKLFFLAAMYISILPHHSVCTRQMYGYKTSVQIPFIT